MRAILTYHSVDPSGSVISTDPAVFERHVRWLASGRVAVVSVTELLTRPDDRDAVALTFDDAFTNFATEAWPRLRAHGLPVTLFAPTAHVGHTNGWAETPGGRMPPLPILDWATLARLQDEGVALGAHSRTHADLRSLNAELLQEEVAGAVEDFGRETGRRPEGFAYPYGYCDARVVAAVRAVCRWACTTELRPMAAGEDPHLLPRLDVFYLHGPGRLEAFGGDAFRWYVRMRAGVHALGQWARTRRRS